MKFGITCLGIAIFLAGAAFQEAIEGLGLNHPDGGYGSMIVGCYFLGLGMRFLSTFRRPRMN